MKKATIKVQLDLHDDDLHNAEVTLANIIEDIISDLNCANGVEEVKVTEFTVGVGSHAEWPESTLVSIQPD